MGRAGSKREVAALAWPLAVGMVSHTLMGVVDTLLMGHVGTAAQAGVGLATTLTFAGVAFFRGLVSGAQSLVAAADGAGRGGRVREAAGAAWLIGLGAGLFAAVALTLLHGPFLALTVDDPRVRASAAAYLAVRAWGLPPTLLAFGCLAVLQGLGDTRTRMRVSLVANALNVGLDLLLIFGAGPVPALGEAGAALASVLATCATAALYARRTLDRVGPPVRPSREVLASVLRVGFPAGLQYVFGVGAFTVMSLLLARAGAAHLAASEVVLHLVGLSFLPGCGVGEAGGVLVGRYLGAGRPGAAARSLASARALAVVFMGSCGVVFALWGGDLVGLFTRDPEVARLGATLMLLAGGFQVLDAVATVHLCALRGAGDTRFSLLVTSGAAWGVLVPGALILGVGLGWGAPGAWLGLTVEVACVAAVTGWRVRGLRRGTVGRLDLLLGVPA